MSFNQTYEQALAKKQARDALRPKRVVPLKGRKPMKRGGRLKAGKKTKQWESVRAKLKKRFAAAGITTCELHKVGRVLPHLCTYDNYLGFAHNAKRRKLTEDDLYHVILICNNAHNIIEVWPAEEMRRIVDGAIAAREVQP